MRRVCVPCLSATCVKYSSVNRLVTPSHTHTHTHTHLIIGIVSLDAMEEIKNNNNNKMLIRLNMQTDLGRSSLPMGDQGD